MPGCAVAKCYSYSRKTKGKNISYYTFPKNEDLQRMYAKGKINLISRTVGNTSMEFLKQFFVLLFNNIRTVSFQG